MKTLLLALQLVVLATHQGDGTNNRWARPIRFPQVAQPTLVAVELDSHAFRYAKPDQSDIRIKTLSGDPESLLIRRPTQTRARLVPTEFQADTVSAGPVAGGGFSMVIRLRPGQPRPDSLRIFTPLRDFEKRVQVEGIGKDSKATLLTEGVIADYSSMVDFRVDSIPLDAGEYRQFRVTIENPTDRQESALRELVRRAGKPQLERLQVTTRPFRVDRIEFSGLAETRDSEQATWDLFSPRALTVTQDPVARETIYQFEADQRPLVGIELTGADGNFRRSVRLEYPEKYRSTVVWKSVASGTLSRLAFQGNTQESTRLTFPEARHGTMRLVVSNLDSPPIQATGLRLLGARVEILFMASPGTVYQIEYGDQRARGPAFDTSGIDAALALGATPATGTLGPPSPVEQPAAGDNQGESPFVLVPDHAHGPEVDAPGASFFQPWIFGMVLFVLGAVLMVSLVQAAAKIDNNKSDSPTGEISVPDKSPKENPPTERKGEE